MPVKLNNNAASRLASSLTAAATSLSVTAGEGSKFPALSAGDWFPITLLKASGQLEIARCTARAGDVLTVSRGQEGTSAIPFDVGDRVELRATAAVFNLINDAISAAADAQDDADLAIKKDALTGTGAALIPAGTEAQRPSTPANGMFRYNAEKNQFEGYQNGSWGQVGGGAPLLSVMWWSKRSAIPAGYVAADGQTLSRATYPEAWAGILAGNVPTAAEATWQSDVAYRGMFTTGDGSTNFRLPDYNGKAAGSLGAVFMRGDGELSAITNGLIQASQNLAHIHSASTASAGGHSHTYSAPVSGPFAGGAGGLQSGLTSQNTSSGGAHTHDVTVNSSGGSEARPINVTGCWVIKLFGAVVNVGSADAAQLASDYANLSSRVSELESKGVVESRIINGNFAVNQRGVSGTVTLAAGAYGHDCWKAGASGCTYTFNNSGGVTTLTITAGSLQQVIEGQNLQTGTHVLSWQGTAQGKIGGGAYSGTGVTASVTGGAGLTIEFGAGTLSLVRFAPGTTAAGYTHKSFGDDLKDCQRYFQRLKVMPAAGQITWASGYGSSTAVRQSVVPSPMRASPTVTLSSTYSEYYNGSQVWTATSIALFATFFDVSTGIITLEFGASVDGTGVLRLLRGTGSDIYASLSAEL